MYLFIMLQLRLSIYLWNASYAVNDYNRKHSYAKRTVLTSEVSMYVHIACKSHVSVNHLHSHVWTFYTYKILVLIFVKYIYIISYKRFWTFTWDCVHVYYISLIAMLSYKSILISCECMYWWLLHYGIDNYTKCNSQTLYMHNTTPCLKMVFTNSRGKTTIFVG
jgi:hypothetical protein